MYFDEVVIEVTGGKGGDGVIQFRREKYVPRGGPDGGDGGHGGSILLEVDQHKNTLSEFRHKKQFQAQDGTRGKGKNQTGASGDDLVLKVPPGTLVFDESDGSLMGDLVDQGQQLQVCKGGRGGRGNTRFKTSKNKAPRIAEKGEPPEEKTLRLELKLIADIGIIGVPNAGKSTMLSVVSNAKPKIAPYPFTTLQPNLGVVELDNDIQLIMADIPGLIEGAHRGEGLGHDFLRHIQRTRVLIHLLDGVSEEPILDFAQINSELALFDPALGDKPQIVVLNKMDLPDVEKKWPQVKSQLLEKGYQDVFSISAITQQGIMPVLYRAAQLLEETPAYEYKVAVDDDALPVYRFEKDPQNYVILKTDRGWRISGEAIERAAAMTYWEHFQSIRRFHRILEAMGVDEAMKEAGVIPGDLVFIGDHELEWEE
ncbi:MAG: GTPase ObgE [Anaerolineales bacterium]|nr:GTPase ObgE [Anaerolineales bacterium]